MIKQHIKYKLYVEGKLEGEEGIYSQTYTLPKRPRSLDEIRKIAEDFVFIQRAKVEEVTNSVKIRLVELR